MDRIRRLCGASLLLALAALGGCDGDSTGPAGTSSDVQVRAYVDADGSGSFSTGDSPVSGLGLTLASTDGGTSLLATTGEDGIASFGDVPPGSYIVAFSADPPAGAVLATASSPVVVAPFNGGSVEAEFRFAFLPGSIAGVLYRDDDGNGSFDPNEDLAAAGIPVALFAGTATEGDPVAETSTDALGAFSFGSLRPGTYTLRFSPLPTMQLAGGTTQTVTVAPQSPTAAAITFTGELVSPISAARAAEVGTVVAVRGAVTSQPSFSDELFIQDASGGIQVFARDVQVRDRDLEPGDSVLVVGSVGAFNGEVQITSVTALEVVGTGAAPTPRPVTAATINDGGVQHQLVRVAGATVVSVDTLSFDNQFVTLTDATGAEFGVYADSRTGVTPAAWVAGEKYDVTGVVGFDNRFPFPNRVEVRGPADVAVAAEPIGIAEARGMEGETVLIEGVVTVDVGALGSSNFYVQDATGGIAVFEPGVARLKIGDRVLLSGPVSAFNEEIQINNATSLTVLASGVPVTPVTVTAAQINAGERQGQLARVENVTVTSVEVTNSFGTQEVEVTDAAGNTLVLFVDNRTGITADAWTVGETYDVTGIVSRFRDLFELKPRRLADVQPAS